MKGNEDQKNMGPKDITMKEMGISLWASKAREGDISIIEEKRKKRSQPRGEEWVNHRCGHHF